jgi:hypothetical protein
VIVASAVVGSAGAFALVSFCSALAGTPQDGMTASRAQVMIAAMM